MDTNQLVFMTSPWASGDIRGNQIAEKLNAICDPREPVSRDSIFVFIKITPNISVPRMYVDIVDAYGLLTSVPRFPEAKLIAISSLAKTYIENRVYNEVILIPEHHCNFENFVREYRPVKTVGFVGYVPNFLLDPLVVKDELSKIGLDFIWLTNFVDRLEICDFYKKIDIQLTFRPKSPVSPCPAELKNPLKLTNAGSFKIPSVCCAEPSYVDAFKDCFLIADNLNSIVKQCRELKNDNALYQHIAERCHVKAQDYHIDNIYPLYEKLKDWDSYEATNEMLEFGGYDMGSEKFFQIKDKGKIVASCKLITRTIKIGLIDYAVGGIREFKVIENRRCQGIGRIMFKDLVFHATDNKLDMLAGFAELDVLNFYVKCNCIVMNAAFDSRSMFYYPIADNCEPKGHIDLMGTMW